MGRMKDQLEPNEMDEKICPICRAPYRGWGNNALPVMNARCCDDCNWMCMIPARVDNLEKGLPRDHRDPSVVPFPQG